MDHERHADLLNGGHEGHDLGELLGPLGLLVAAVVVAFFLARNPQVRARVLALWEQVWQHPRTRALVRRGRGVRTGASSAGDESATPVERLDLRRLALYPAELRDALSRVDAATAALHVPRDAVSSPEGPLMDHRAQVLRTILAELVDTLAQIPPDLAQQATAEGSSPVQDAAATAALLEQEANLLRAQLYAGLAARLQRQRSFVVGKYLREGQRSPLDLS